jgi:sterol desaturase/sphingolipid hydroxylase (fatty acid hydroxylase superfamily)
MTEALARLAPLFERAISLLSVSTAGPDSRVHLPYLLGALALATAVWLVRGRRSLASFLFPRAVWLHRSARLDYRLLVVRGILNLLWLSSLSVSTAAVGMAVARVLWRHAGILPRFSVDPWLVIALFSLAAFLAEDLARYALHWSSHRVPALWELHKLHHSAEVLTPFTVYRTHPLYGLLMTTGSALAIGAVAGVFMWLFPGAVRAYEVSGVYALSFAWNVLGANLRHSHVWLSYGRVLEHVLLSPAQHQIHHSLERRHHDRNFGSALALWDLLFGTLYVTRGRERLRFGLAETERNHTDATLSALLGPLLAAVRRIVPSRAGVRRTNPRRGRDRVAPASS